MDPSVAAEFSVVDCFKNSKFPGRFKADSVAPNHIMKGLKIWRAINLENKQNGVLFNTNNKCVEIGLFEIIKFGLFEKKLNAFSSDDFNEAASSRLNQNQLLALIALHDTSEVTSFDALGNSSTEKVITNRYLQGKDIKGYLIKEDWVVESYSGQTNKYIIAFAPLFYDAKKDKVLPLFWLYYPEWKILLASFEARNFYSYERISYKDVFEKRYFMSAISKENNLFNRGVKTYSHGDDAYLESEQIKEKLNHAENDLFQY